MDNTTETEKPSQQCLITERIQGIANNLKGEGDELIKSAVDVYSKYKFIDMPYPDYSHTADEILESKEFRGCQDAGTVLVALLRAKGMNVTFIQAFIRDNVENFTGKMNGHVFVRLISDDIDEKGNHKSRIIDSTTGVIADEIPNDFILAFEGIDAWDAGLCTPDNYYDLYESMIKASRDKNSM